MRFWLISMFALVLACGESNSAGSNGFEGCGDVLANCAPTSSCATVTCPFDGSAIDCTTACQNVLAVCTGGCPGASCGAVVDMPTCMAACSSETSFSCGNATFGCYASNDSCSSISGCLGCSP